MDISRAKNVHILDVLKAVAQVTKERVVQMFQHPSFPYYVPHTLGSNDYSTARQQFPIVVEVSGETEVADFHLSVCTSAQTSNQCPFARLCGLSQTLPFLPLAEVESD